MEDRSWVYRSSDVLAHFQGVCVFLEIVVQHGFTLQRRDNIFPL
jgi:hypothetical protein